MSDIDIYDDDEPKKKLSSENQEVLENPDVTLHISPILRDTFARQSETCDDDLLTEKKKEKTSNGVFSCFQIGSSRKRADEIEYLYKKVQQKSNLIQELMEWRKFPSDLHEKAHGQNYLACKIWILTYGLLEVDNPGEQEIRHESTMSDLYAELLAASEDMGAGLTNYSRALFKLKNLFERIHISRPKKGPTPFDSETKIDHPPAFDKSLIIGENDIINFDTLRTGIRDSQNRFWYRFKNRKDSFLLVGTGLNEMISDCLALHVLLKETYKILTEALSTCPCRKSIIPTLKWLKKYNKKLKAGKDPPPGEEVALYFTAFEHFESIISRGDKIVEETTRLVLMIRLCYVYMRGGTGDVTFCLKMDSYEKIISEKFHRDIRKLVKWVNFDVADFKKVPCPAALRRVPVLIARTNELGLYDEEYQRLKRKSSKTTSTVSSAPSRLSTNPTGGNRTSHDVKLSFNLKRFGNQHQNYRSKSK